ncbi:hypothetical protein OESDEN_13268 [Oesophagostomum dentatum]|uniref:Uncharacterized protein n=1 Tax=Oesophagostomum dentatum TaxID=61180 RepID=A0A0B1SSU3_OESDE|nr:hypothetical protein OESDEN_13268 [Oesophagostomum dentatum]
MQDVLNGASDSILLGTNRIGNEEGAFVVHEDIARSYEYQSNDARSGLLQHGPYIVLGLISWIGLRL